MSELKTTSLSHKDNNTGTPNITMYSDGTTSLPGTALAGFRNQIINGDFGIWQRGTSIALPDSTNPSSQGTYTADRWFGGAPLDRVAQAQSGVGNFAYEANITPGSDATSKGSITQSVELSRPGYPCQFVPGSTWTLSFYSNRSTLNAAGSFCDGANSFGTGTATSVFAGTPALIPGETQRYSTTFTIPSSLTIDATNTSFAIRIGLTTADQVRLSGVQLEPGPVATPFEHRPMGTELALCQRYFVKQNFGSNLSSKSVAYSTGNFSIQLPYLYYFPVEMRVQPTTDFTGLIVKTGTTVRTASLNYSETPVMRYIGASDIPQNTSGSLSVGGVLLVDAEL